MNEYTLNRTGQRPVKFTGELITESQGKPAEPQRARDKARNYDIRIYKTARGTYLAAITYNTDWDDEEHREDVLQCNTPAEVADCLEKYDPTQNVVGFPPGQQFAAKQQRLLAALRAQFQRQVMEVLSAIPGSEQIID